jgi:hypothetical protein
MRIKKKLATTGVAALIGLTGTAVGAAVLPAAPASAEVLINYPGTAVKVGHTFTVGDWFQQWSGGSRWFSTTVYGPTGARVFRATGYAPSTHWAMWPIRATRPGGYQICYETRRSDGRLISTTYSVRAYR